MKEFNGEKFYTGFEVSNIIDDKNINLFFNGLKQYHYFNGLVNFKILSYSQFTEKLKEDRIFELVEPIENSLTSIFFKDIFEVININGFLINSSFRIYDEQPSKRLAFTSICYNVSNFVDIKQNGVSIKKDYLLFPSSPKELINCVDTLAPVEFLSSEEIEEINHNINDYMEIGKQVNFKWLKNKMFSNKYIDTDNLADNLAVSLIDEVTNYKKAIITPYYLETEIEEKANNLGIKYNFNEYEKKITTPKIEAEPEIAITKEKSYFRGERNLKLALYAMANLLAEENEIKFKHKSSKKINVAEIAKHIASYLEENKEDFVNQPRLKSGYFATEYGKIKKDLSNYIEQALTDIEEEI